MKKILFTLLCLTAAFDFCIAGNPKVAAKYVPERKDDFMYENNLVAGRIYGRALEDCGKGQLVSPGFDVWVKVPGELVAEKRYENEFKHHMSYHKNWGDGKDCYKVGRSLGAGASSPIVDGKLCLPATNYREWKILKQTDNKVVFVLKYPEWKLDNGVIVSLEKKFTIVPDTYFIKCEDRYRFKGTKILTIAAGVNRHEKQGTLIDEELSLDRYALWEHASGTFEEPEEGLIGVSVVMPGSEKVCLTDDKKHAVCCKTIRSGQILTYWFGSCWTGGNIKDFETWKAEVAKIEQ